MKKKLNTFTLSFIITILMIINVPNLIGQWQHLGGPSGRITVRDVSVSNVDTLYAADASRLVKSINRGQSWQPTARLIEAPLVVSSNLQNSSRVVVGKKDTIWFSDDGGNTTLDRLTGVHPNRLVRCPDEPRFVYLGTNFVTGSRSLRFSNNNGQNWPMENPPSSTFSAPTNVTDIAVKRGSVSQVIWVSGTDLGAAATMKGLWHTTNGGQNWAYIDNVHQKNITAIGLRTNPDTLMVGSADGRLYQRVGLNLATEVSNFPNKDVKKIYSIAYTGNTWLVGAKGGLFRRDLTGWKPLFPNWKVFNIKVYNGVVYIATDRGVMRSSDHGQNWSENTQTTPTKIQIPSMASSGGVVLTLNREGKHDERVAEYKRRAYFIFILSFI